MLAYAIEQSFNCPMCGTERWKWEEDPEAYSAVIERCPGCAARDMMREQSGDASSSPGASVSLIPHAEHKRLRAMPAKRPLSPRERAGKAPPKKG